MPFSTSQFLSGVSADATTIGLDMPGGGYDWLHALLEQHVSLPAGKARRTSVVALALTASRLVEQQFGSVGPVANFLKEIAEDTVRELSKRILESADRATDIRKRLGKPSASTDAVWAMDEGARRQLLEQYRKLDAAGQQQMREQMLRSTAEELAVLAGLPQEDLGTLLTLLAPKPATPIMKTALSGLDTVTARLNRWAGR